MKGLDENGNNVDKAIITGKCYVSVATDSQINKLKAAFPELAITYGQLKPAPVTTFTFSSSQRKSLANSAFECAYEVEKVNEYTYKVTSEDNITIDFTFKCENHEDFKGSYLVAGTRSQSYTVTYIPLRKIRVGFITNRYMSKVLLSQLETDHTFLMLTDMLLYRVEVRLYPEPCLHTDMQAIPSHMVP